MTNLEHLEHLWVKKELEVEGKNTFQGSNFKIEVMNFYAGNVRERKSKTGRTKVT